METEGKVLCVEDKTAVVQIIRKGACGENCAHCAGCSAKTIEIKAVANLNVQIGDWVELSSKNSPVFLGLFILFILPLALPLVAYLISIGSGLEGIAAVVGLLTSFALICFLNKSVRFQRLSAPRITRIILRARNKNE